MTRAEYMALRAAVIEAGYEHEIDWAENVAPPDTADDFAGEAIWVICCSGFKEQRARVTQERVSQALARGESATTVFPSSGKGRAIDTIWAERAKHFDDLQELIATGSPPIAFVEWIATLPYVGGPILRYHFAKNMGVDIAKPDRHLERVAAAAGVDVQYLCRRLARETGDRIATVDLVIWRACNLGLWRTP